MDPTSHWVGHHSRTLTIDEDGGSLTQTPKWPANTPRRFAFREGIEAIINLLQETWPSSRSHPDLPSDEHGRHALARQRMIASSQRVIASAVGWKAAECSSAQALPTHWRTWLDGPGGMQATAAGTRFVFVVPLFLGGLQLLVARKPSTSGCTGCWTGSHYCCACCCREHRQSGCKQPLRTPPLRCSL